MFIIFGLLEISALVDSRPRKKMYTIFSVSKNLKRKRYKSMNRFGVREIFCGRCKSHPQVIE